MNHSTLGSPQGRTRPSRRLATLRGVALLVLSALAPAHAAEGAPAVAPEAGTAAERLAKKSKADDPVVTYTGLRVHDDGSATLRVEISKRVAVQKSGSGTEVRFFLPGARITIRNNRNPLLAQHFASSIVSAEIVPSKEGVTVVVKLRQPLELSPQMVDQAGGASTLRVEIPASKAPAPAPTK